MNLKKWIVSAFALNIIFWLGGCIAIPAPRFVKLDDGCEGIVINIEDKQPISGAVVTRRCGYQAIPNIKQVTTTKNGRYEFGSCWEFRFWYHIIVFDMFQEIQEPWVYSIEAEGYELAEKPENMPYIWFYTEDNYHTVYMRPVSQQEQVP